MLDQIDSLRAHVKSAIRVYESLFTAKKRMPDHRCIDIVDLRIILDRHYRDLNSCMNAVKQRLSIFKTGWWIFKTGRSRLRNGIMSVLQAYENPITQGLVAEVSEMRQRFDEIRAKKAPVLSNNRSSTSEGVELANVISGALFSFSIEEATEPRRLGRW